MPKEDLMDSWLTQEEYQEEISAYETVGKSRALLCLVPAMVLVAGLLVASNIAEALIQARDYQQFAKNVSPTNRQSRYALDLYSAAAANNQKKADTLSKMVTSVGETKSLMESIKKQAVSDTPDLALLEKQVNEFMLMEYKKGIDPTPSAYLTEVACLLPEAVLNQKPVREDGQTLWNKYLAFSFCG